MRFASFLAAFSVASAALGFACANSADDPTDDLDDAGGQRGPDSSTTRSDSGTKKDSGGGKDGGKRDGATITPGGDACLGESETYDACNLTDMQCGPEGYVAWCRENEAATDSAQRIAARAQCLGTAYCSPQKRADCIYTAYNDAEQTSAQAALLEHYCAACEPSAVEACKTRTLNYVPGAPSATDTIFLASWELAASLVDAIDANCIAPLAGIDAGSCATAFDQCAGGYYIDALVDKCEGD